MGTTVSTELVHHGEQRDRVGRLHVPVQRRRELLAAFRESGLTRVAFARREGLRYTTLCTWVQRDDKVAGRAKAPEAGPGPSTKPALAAVRFLEAALPAVAAAPGGLSVRLPDGTELRGSSASELAALVRALRD